MATHLNMIRRQINAAGLMLPRGATGSVVMSDDPRLIEIGKGLDKAVPFLVDDISEINQFKYIPELFKLPYPAVWLELSANALGVDHTNVVKGYGFLVLECDEGDHGDEAIDAIGIDVLQFMFDGNIWILAGGFRFYPASNHIYSPSLTNKNSVFGAYGIPNLPDDIESLSVDRLGCFLSALNCTNVVANEVKAPKFINAKRKKKNKVPIDSYYTLMLKGRTEKGEKVGGSHASPRLHLRRGHIREYRPGMFTWVQACAVGDAMGGTIDKDYKLKTA